MFLECIGAGTPVLARVGGDIEVENNIKLGGFDFPELTIAGEVDVYDNDAAEYARFPKLKV